MDCVGSGSMLSESIHSLADMANQLLLAIGIRVPTNLCFWILLFTLQNEMERKNEKNQ